MNNLVSRGVRISPSDRKLLHRGKLIRTVPLMLVLMALFSLKPLIGLVKELSSGVDFTLGVTWIYIVIQITFIVGMPFIISFLLDVIYCGVFQNRILSLSRRQQISRMFYDNN